MLAQKTRGSIVSITHTAARSSYCRHECLGCDAHRGRHPGDLDERRNGICQEWDPRAVAPGVVETPLHKDNPKDFLKTRSPMAGISSVDEIVDAVLFLTKAPAQPGRC
ncbi:short-chain dehydrogenase/reductase SDR [Rhizobium favelukesii]|uniref:Short-chain dehydrogenase/reductase SDR n=1 Tax=Rhizobium favelukesii TaxID=348824 RepID=W6R840_9HYPH|nr:short-chain dehydrogenase/reductase SDR [Rhizobium favelukesii]